MRRILLLGLFCISIDSPVSAQMPTRADLIKSGLEALAVSGSVTVDCTLPVPPAPYYINWESGYSFPGPPARRVATTAMVAEAFLREDSAWGCRNERLAHGAIYWILDNSLTEIEAPGSDQYERGLSYAFCMRMLRVALATGREPVGTQPAIDAIIEEYLNRMAHGLLPNPTGVGKGAGWYYTSNTLDQPCFVTAPVMISMLEAQQDGYDVCQSAIVAGLDQLEASRSSYANGPAFQYLGLDPPQTAFTKGAGSLIGSAGRTAHCERALYLWGRSTLGDLVLAVDTFFTFYPELSIDVTLSGVPVPPAPCNHDATNSYIACWYLLYSHYQTAWAVEQLPSPAPLRASQLTFLTDLQITPGGPFTDIVTAQNPGTAMAVLALQAQASVSPPPVAAPVLDDFIRGDANGDGFVGLPDLVLIAAYVSGAGSGQGVLICPQDIADIDDDGVVNFTDVTRLASLMTSLGNPLPMAAGILPGPYPATGPDPTPDGLY